MHRAAKFRIYPTPDQELALTQIAGASRFVFNLALEQRRDWWRQFKASTGRNLSWLSQSKELTDLRREQEWLAAIPRCILQQALRDLDKAFGAFWRGAGFPRFRTARTHRSFRVPGGECGAFSLNAKWCDLKLPKVGKVKLRMTRALPTALTNVTIRQDGRKWFAIVTHDAEPTSCAASGVIGIDRGVKNTISLSTGEHFSPPSGIADVIAARRRAQRALSRCKKGSGRRCERARLVAELHRRAAAMRSHWLHERSTDIARRFSQVAIENLSVAHMIRAGKGKRGLNRSILEQGWSIFASMLEYKLAERGGMLHFVNPAYTSQTCSECGSVNAESRKSQAAFQCVECGHAAHADTNAAINILRRSPAGVEGAGYGPVETRTGAMLTHRENLAA